MKYIYLLLLLSAQITFSQTQTFLDDLGLFIKDAIFYSDKYITPATDAAVYQASSAWVNTVKKKKLLDFTLGVNANVFLVPNSDKTFQLNNSDLSFFSIENSNSVEVPSALGNDLQYYMSGDLDGTAVRIETPQGIDQQFVFYPHLYGSLTLWYGTDLLVKFSPYTKLKKSEYQVYGVGLKHNIDQYFNALKKNKINLATTVSYSKEDVRFAFLDINTPYGTLGINQLSGLVDTYQFQVNASKEYKKTEIIVGIISNTSDFKYVLSGPVGTIESVIPVQNVLNENLKNIYKTKTNILAEVSCRYQISKVFLQTTLAFGKFVNSNFSVQYEF
jgi:hypothetical protein